MMATIISVLAIFLTLSFSTLLDYGKEKMESILETLKKEKPKREVEQINDAQSIHYVDFISVLEEKSIPWQRPELGGNKCLISKNDIPGALKDKGAREAVCRLQEILSIGDIQQASQLVVNDDLLGMLLLPLPREQAGALKKSYLDKNFLHAKNPNFASSFKEIQRSQEILEKLFSAFQKFAGRDLPDNCQQAVKLEKSPTKTVEVCKMLHLTQERSKSLSFSEKGIQRDILPFFTEHDLQKAKFLEDLSQSDVVEKLIHFERSPTMLTSLCKLHSSETTERLQMETVTSDREIKAMAEAFIKLTEILQELTCH